MHVPEKIFLATSKRVSNRLTEVFDFVWPTAAAIWNLRWQVSGYLSVNPSATTSELSSRFLLGSGISGANLKRGCIEKTWDEQQQEFSRFLLVEFCALYEAWCEGIADELGIPDDLARQLQFPTSPPRKNWIGGVGNALATINKNICPELKSTIHLELSSHRKNSLPNLEELLVCYRYFKEARNFLMHNSKKSESNLIAAESKYSTQTAVSLGVKELPQFHPHSVGSSLKLSLRGVVGFGEVVLRLVCTLDAELSYSSFAEATLEKRWMKKHGKNLQIAYKHKARYDRIKRLFRQIDLPIGKSAAQLEGWLKSKSLIV